MKPALEWLNEIGETVANDMFSPDSGKPGDRTLELIERIQKDAIEIICGRLTRLEREHNELLADWENEIGKPWISE